MHMYRWQQEWRRLFSSAGVNSRAQRRTTWWETIGNLAHLIPLTFYFAKVGNFTVSSFRWWAFNARLTLTGFLIANSIQRRKFSAQEDSFDETLQSLISRPICRRSDHYRECFSVEDFEHQLRSLSTHQQQISFIIAKTVLRDLSEPYERVVAEKRSLQLRRHHQL